MDEQGWSNKHPLLKDRIVGKGDKKSGIVKLCGVGEPDAGIRARFSSLAGSRVKETGAGIGAKCSSLAGSGVGETGAGM